MADNIPVTPGTGATVAADDVGGILFQRVKIGVGSDGIATDLAFGQANKAGSLPVTIASDQNTIAVSVPVGQATKAGSTSVTIASDQGIIPVSIPVGQQTKAASTPVVIASDQGSVAVTVPIGQAAMASSTPVVIASNQTPISVTVPIGQQTKAVSTPVVIASDQDVIPVNQQSSAFVTTLSVTRPADTNAYTAGDVVGPTSAALAFTSIGTTAATIIINSASLEYDVAAVPTGMGNMRLYLYTTTPPSALADNAAWDLVSGDRTSFVGYIDLGIPVDLGSTCFVQSTNINQIIKLAAGSTSLYGYLVTSTGFTPTSADVFKIKLIALVV